jgi:hypothetical protein
MQVSRSFSIPSYEIYKTTLYGIAIITKLNPMPLPTKQANGIQGDLC